MPNTFLFMCVYNDGIHCSIDTEQTNQDESSSEENHSGIVNPEDLAYYKRQKPTSEQKRALAMVCIFLWA